jgi:hypothetical protein
MRDHIRPAGAPPPSAVSAGWSVSATTSFRPAARPSVALRRLHLEKDMWIGSSPPHRRAIWGKTPCSVSRSSAMHLRSVLSFRFQAHRRWQGADRLRANWPVTSAGHSRANESSRAAARHLPPQPRRDRGRSGRATARQKAQRAGARAPGGRSLKTARGARGRGRLWRPSRLRELVARYQQDLLALHAAWEAAQ